MSSRRTALPGRLAYRVRRASACAMLLGAFVGWGSCQASASGSHPMPGASDPSLGASAPSPAVDPEWIRQASPLQWVEQGVRFEHGEGVPRDLARAHELYCAAAREGHVDGLLRLGWMYANGRGVARDDAYASTLFAKAATLGSELGARLAGAIRGDGERLPACMTPPPAATATADHGPTPVIEGPAQFLPGPSSADARALVTTVIRMARDFRLDPRLVFALIRVESGFDPMARSNRNAQGLMQLIPETAERFGVANVWNPVENLRGGMSYLRWLLSYFKGDVVLTLAAYNAGEGAVDRHGGVPPFAETVAYVQRIRAMYPFDRHAFDPRIASAPPRLARAGP